MKATIWHNPKCSNSRLTLELLDEAGADVTIVEYLKTPPSRDELRRLYARAGISAAEGLRAKEPMAKELGLAESDDETILDAMIGHPVLIERPLVETERGVRLCRPPETVKEIL